MKVVQRIFVSLALALGLTAGAVSAQGSSNWTRAQVPSGAAAVQLPCVANLNRVGNNLATEVAACNWSGLEIILMVLPETDWSMTGVSDRPFEQTIEQLRQDSSTEYLRELDWGGAPAFVAEGRSARGKLGSAMVQLDGGRLLVLMVQSNGSAQAESRVATTFARIWGSLEIAQQ